MKENQTPTIIVAEPHSAERVYGVLTLAFSDDPANRWLFSEAEQYLRHFPAFARALGGAALHLRTALVSSDYSAVALWLAPDVGPDEQALTSIVDHVASEKRNDIATVFEEMGRHHPQEPHWYLPFIGVEPMHRNHGLGTELLRTQLANCDAAQLPAYLDPQIRETALFMSDTVSRLSPRSKWEIARRSYRCCGDPSL